MPIKHSLGTDHSLYLLRFLLPKSQGSLRYEMLAFLSIPVQALAPLTWFPPVCPSLDSNLGLELSWCLLETGNVPLHSGKPHIEVGAMSGVGDWGPTIEISQEYPWAVPLQGGWNQKGKVITLIISDSADKGLGVDVLGKTVHMLFLAPTASGVSEFLAQQAQVSCG